MGPMKHEHRSLIFFASKYIFKDCNDERLREVLDKSAMKQLIVVFTISALMFIGYLMFLALPYILFFVYGQHNLLLSSVLPYLELDTNWGYMLNMLNMSMISCLVVFLNIGADSTFSMIVNNMWAGVDVVKFAMHEMDTSFQRTGNRKEQAAQFRNILIQIQDLDR